MAYFSFNDAPNVCFMWKIWTAGRSVQHPDSATMKPSCCNSCSMWFCIVLLKYTRLEGSICCSNTFIYLSAFIVPSKTCKLPIPYAIMHPIYQRCWLLNWSLITRWKSPSSLARRTRHPWFPIIMSNLDSSDHGTLLQSLCNLTFGKGF